MKKKSVLLGISFCSVNILSVIVASIAWFESSNEIRLNDGAGYTENLYYERGDGSLENPYIISRPNHLYNFAWLQYLGTYNTDNSVTYFKLNNDLDMSDYVLPPIGTTNNPFIGVFDGQGYTISNLTVSNSLIDMPSRPYNVNTIEGVSIVGFFGVVGDPENTGLVGTSAFDYSSVTDGLSASNFYLENVAIKSTSERTLIGVVAGYVDGSIHDVGVKNASLEVANNATGLVNYGEVLSKYSLIGDTTDTDWEQAYTNKNSGETPGGDTGFGGSINMWDVNRRVTYILKKDLDGTPASYAKTKYNGSGTYNVYLYMANTTRLCVTQYGPVGDGDNSSDADLTNDKPRNSGVINLRSGYLPINTDTSTMFEGTDTITTLQPTSTSYKKYYFAINDYYQNHTSEIISDNNTGYFVGDKAYGTSSTSGTVVFGSKSKTMISKSYSSKDGDLKIYSISPSDSTGDFKYIKDTDNQSSSIQSGGTELSHFGYTNYSNVVENAKASLDNALTTGYLNGFRLGYYNPSATTVVNATNVKISGTTYPSYQFINRGVNFSVESQGKITLLLTGYGDSITYSKSMFRLFSVTRNASHNVTALTEITKVYANSTSNSISYNTASSANDVLVYDYSKWDNTLQESTLYYCEIPVNPGDYYIGGPSTSGSQSTGYLVYLDIGSNGSGGSGSSGTIIESETLYNVRYVDIIPQSASGETYIDILFKLSTAATNGSSRIFFKRNSITSLYYYDQNQSSDISIFIMIFPPVDGMNDSDIAQSNASAIWIASE